MPMNPILRAADSSASRSLSSFSISVSLKSSLSFVDSSTKIVVFNVGLEVGKPVGILVGELLIGSKVGVFVSESFVVLISLTVVNVVEFNEFPISVGDEVGSNVGTVEGIELVVNGLGVTTGSLVGSLVTETAEGVVVGASVVILHVEISLAVQYTSVTPSVATGTYSDVNPSLSQLPPVFVSMGTPLKQPIVYGLRSSPGYGLVGLDTKSLSGP